MANGIRLDLQEALARGPSGVPDMPVFQQGAIPPTFGPEFPDPNEFETVEAPVSEELDLSNVPDTPVLSAATVPAPSPSRGDRLRKLLGNFLQNFSEGLLASARAPSGSEFSAAIGGALSAPAERRRQQVFADLQRASQTFRQQDIALRQARLDQQAAQFQQTFAFTQAQTKRPRTFEAFAVNLLQAGDEAGARKIIELSRGNPEGRLITRQAGQDLVGLDPTTLNEITRIPDFFPPPKVKPRKAQALTEGERGRLSVELLRQFGIIQPESRIRGLMAEGEFGFMLKRKRIATKIDALTRAGLGVEEILRLFERAKQGLRERQEAVTLDSVLAEIRSTPRRSTPR